MAAMNRVFSLRIKRPVRNRSTAPADVQDLLNRTCELLRRVSPVAVPEALDNLITTLGQVRAEVGIDGWKSLVGQIRRHPLGELLRQDPLTHRGFHKPRGYACDAAMLDLIYRSPGNATPAGLTELGAHIWDCIATTSLAQGIRNRRDMIACQIDAAAESTDGAEILALEAGHLREAEMSIALKHRSLRRFIALDQDSHAIETIEHELGRSGVVAIHTPTYALLNGAPNALGKFDFIYSAGLFERLEMRPAIRALAAIFAMLKPGGKIWISNLLPEVREAAYIEAFMNWWPIYRDIRELEALAVEIPQVEVISSRVLLEPADSVAFLEIIRGW